MSLAIVYFVFQPSHAFSAISQQTSENFADGAPEALKSTASIIEIHCQIA